MIVSHEHRFIFLKTSKTAGTSIEVALSRHCGPKDIITPLSDADEAIRSSHGARGPQHFKAPLREYSLRDLAHSVRHRRSKPQFYNHMSAVAVRRLLGEQTWQSYFKFCVVRNPWDRFVSFYFWRHRSEPRPTISHVLATDEPLRLKHFGLDVYTIDGRVGVDKVCRYENLKEDLDEVRRRVGISETLELPSSKSQFRPDRRSYRELLTDNERDRIAELFAPEIALFGYQF